MCLYMKDAPGSAVLISHLEPGFDGVMIQDCQMQSKAAGKR